VGAAIITGSPHSVTRREPWADALAKWTSRVVDEGRFLLGVCYGHQILAHAQGGTVAKNPNGYEVGTITVELSEEGASDPILGPLARVRGGAGEGAGEGAERPTLDFHSTHQDAVVELPKGALLLASTLKTPVQAFRIGERAWGVQFHPEFTESVMRIYIERRLDVIRSDAKLRGADPRTEIERVERSVRATPHGRLLLRRFVEHAFG
jgi:GMP synthase (glutamine-hydrolysing)